MVEGSLVVEWGRVFIGFFFRVVMRLKVIGFCKSGKRFFDWFI